MKDTEVKRLVYQDSEAFKEGVKVGKKEMIEKATLWLFENIFYYPEESDKIELFIKAMEE